VKFAKWMLGSMVLVPTLAFGIAQQDPAVPAQQLQQDRAAMPAAEHSHTGIVMEVRDDSFSLKTDEGKTIWFAYTPELKAASASEILTGNRLTVYGTAGAAPDRMNATRIERDANDTADVDVDVDVDNDSVTAELDTDRDIDNDRIADNDLRNDDDTYETDNDSDELPQTASSLPAIGSLGLLALLGAAVFAVARKF
jgi:hypothetical protein